MDPGFWETPPTPTGLYRVVVQSTDWVVSTKSNGKLRYDGHYGAGSVHMARADEEVTTRGFGPYRFLLASFTQDYLEEQLSAWLTAPNGVELREVHPSMDAGLAYLARAHEAGLSNGWSGTQLYFDVIRQAMFNRILFRYATRPIGAKSFSEILVSAKVRRIIDHIEANLANDLRLSELSAVACISRAHFARAFRNSMGIAPHAFVLQRRLARASELIGSRKMLIRTVALHCGFADPAHLTRAFKSRFGYPPSLHK
jgi:AraC-like DNA-binding protein